MKLKVILCKVRSFTDGYGDATLSVALFQHICVFKQLSFLQHAYYQFIKSKIVFHFVSLIFRKLFIINLLGLKSVSPVSSVSHTRETAA
jgi:hypothetical protein